MNTQGLSNRHPASQTARQNHADTRPPDPQLLRHPIRSAIMEGINNRIGRLTRMADGYRDVDFLHLLIYALHEPKHILTST